MKKVLFWVAITLCAVCTVLQEFRDEPVWIITLLSSAFIALILMLDLALEARDERFIQLHNYMDGEEYDFKEDFLSNATEYDNHEN